MSVFRLRDGENLVSVNFEPVERLLDAAVNVTTCNPMVETDGMKGLKRTFSRFPLFLSEGGRRRAAPRSWINVRELKNAMN